MSALTDRIDALEDRARHSLDGLLCRDDLEMLTYLYALHYGDTPKVCLARRGSS